MQLKYFFSLTGVRMNKDINILLQDYLGERPIVSSDLDFIDDPSHVGGSSNVTTYYSFENSGVEIGVKENIVDSIHFFVNKKSVKLRFENGEINKYSTKDDVVGILGNPNKTGGGKNIGLLGFVGEWFLYKKGSNYINISFSKELRVESICLMVDFDI